MTRLPKPGSDDGKWGDILNDYLSQSHTSEGKLKPGSVTTDTIAPGAVTKATVGLDNVNNTADADKPVSTATQTALNTKADTSALAGKLNTADLDTQTAAKINDGTSMTTGALTALITESVRPGEPGGAGTLDEDGRQPEEQVSERVALMSPRALWSSRPDFYICAHRAGAGVGPEETIEVGEAMVAAGADRVDFDVQRLADGTLVCMHDVNALRTCGIDVNLKAIDMSVWSVLDAAATSAWPAVCHPPTLRQVLQRFGGRVSINLGPKDSADCADIMDMVHDFGLAGSVTIITTTVAAVSDIKARGGLAGFSYLTNGSLATPTPASLIAAGVDLFTVNVLDTYSDSDIEALVATGVPVMGWTVRRRIDRDRCKTFAMAGINADQPTYLLRDTAFGATDMWQYGVKGQGLVRYSPSMDERKPIRIEDGVLYLDGDASHGRDFFMYGHVCPITNPTNFTLEVSVGFQAIPSGAGNVGVAFGMADDTNGYNLSGNYLPGYFTRIDKDGNLALYRWNGPSSATQLGSIVSTAALAPGELATLQITVTSSNVTVKRTDSGGFTPITSTDTTYRGGYLHFGKTNAADAAGMFANLTIT